MVKTLFTIVAFRYNQKRSIMYVVAGDRMKIAQLVDKALGEDGADVISIRRIYAEHPIGGDNGGSKGSK